MSFARIDLPAAAPARLAKSPNRTGVRLRQTAPRQIAPAFTFPIRGTAPQRNLYGHPEKQHTPLIFRDQDDLLKGLSEIQGLKQRAAMVRVEGSRLFNPGWHLARDLKSMLTVSEAVALSALERKESRGAHSRIDYPNYDDNWGKQNNIIQRDGDKMELRQRPTTEMTFELKQILEGK